MDNREQAEKIARLLFEINKNIHREVAREIERFGITVPQFYVLRILDKEPNLSVSEISQRAGLTNSTISGIVDRLEKEGLVARARDARDRRVVYVHLTQKTKELKKQVSLKTHYFDKWIKDLDPAKVDQIIDSLTLLARTLG